MSLSIYLLNIVFSLLSITIVFGPVKRIMRYCSYSLADYVAVLIYFFMCFPVLCDLVFGIPNYSGNFTSFYMAASNFETCLIYNIYVLFVLIIIVLYAKKSNKADNKNEMSSEKIILIEASRLKVLDFIIIFLPLVFAIVKYGVGIFIGYGSLTYRGLENADVNIINQLLSLSIFVCITRFFSEHKTKKDYILLFIYFFAISWLNGKRYIILSILEEFLLLYQFSKQGDKKRIKLETAVPLFAVLIFFLSMFFYEQRGYNTSTFDLVYCSLRIDFGRDDVTKYAIYKVLICGEKIVDYPGATFLSALFMLLPRTIWSTKPYPHYLYLTASITNRTIFNLSSGITPSLFEMSICNFRWLGILLTPFIISICCKVADKSKKITTKLFVLVLVTIFLTQSINEALVLIIYCIIMALFSRVKFMD